MKKHHERDPGLEEIWAVRERHAAEVGYDLTRLVQFYLEYQKQFEGELIPAPVRGEAGRRPAA
jgi:hypothetical protein